jgi:hypothetical protein
MSISNTPPPLSNYGILSGQLFLYAGGRAAFESSLPPPSTTSTITKKCILIGGLSDGLLPVPYTQELENACQQNQWSLVQPILSSSYMGFGNGSLSRDCDELQELMRYLVDYRHAQEFCLVGHSTGCQDAVYFLEHAAPEFVSKLRIVALQAPVSDREGAMSQPKYQEHLELAQSLVTEGKGQEMMPRAAFWAPITAQRLLDLQEKGGTDDYFSSDYTDDELCSRLQHVGGGTSAQNSNVEDNNNNNVLQVLVAYSGADEYAPSHVDKSLLTDRIVSAMNSKCSASASDGKPSQVAQRLFIETGNHNLSKGPGDGKLFVDKLAELFKSV